MRLGMWVRVASCAGLLIPALQVHADVKMIVNSGGYKITEYIKGTLSRRDIGAAGQYEILDPATHRLLRVDPATRQYYAYYLITASCPGNSRHTISIDISAKDTAEQQPMFGRQAHHFIVTTRRSDDFPGMVPHKAREWTDDVWYLDIDDTRPPRTTVLQ